MSLVRLRAEYHAIARVGLATGPAGFVATLLLVGDREQARAVVGFSVLVVVVFVALAGLSGLYAGVREAFPSHPVPVGAVLEPTDVTIRRACTRALPLQIAVMVPAIAFTGPVVPGMVTGLALVFLVYARWVSRFERAQALSLFRERGRPRDRRRPFYSRPALASDESVRREANAS